MRKVFVSGCFDLIHPGHLEILEFARGLGDYLIVSIGSDETLTVLKRKPIINEHGRYLMVKALRCVDECFIAYGSHDNDDCFQYIKNYKPDVWVVNETDCNFSGKKDLAKRLGIKIVVNHRPERNYSTTGIINEVKLRN